ncbi:hypothetical protein K461DRAFT_274520 [Myriangium duriaei CBS 260.36]|uniref:Uncharacterized protein n=1 Tax=Myriangium duriaei CBS 260.36 TaxID=1168546 RepID=A0A9P4J4Z8_9PEZI|nr:hypothetical protein K461DRAFT_274520 [Myriangium duriaei CBS 260.36]
MTELEATGVVVVVAGQERIVNDYLSVNATNYPAGTFNITGRGFPDLALLGANVTISGIGQRLPSVEALAPPSPCLLR